MSNDTEEIKRDMPEVKTSLKNTYDHTQHEVYNDALSSVLEAQSYKAKHREEMLNMAAKLEDLIDYGAERPYDTGRNKGIQESHNYIRTLIGESDE